MKGRGKVKSICMLMLVMLLQSGIALADPPAGPYPPGMPGGGHGAWGDQQGAPIDGGLGFLLLMGGIYAVRKARRQKRERSGPL